jgi:uncharacterized protein YutE (UPF0331/DUF86 family)
MYFVDRDQIEKTLVFIEVNLKSLKEQSNWTSSIEKLALERISHTIIEAILDVGNHMIDGFIMRDPGSYEDIIDILLDEKVVDEQNANQLRDLVRLRKILVQSYINVNHEEVVTAMNDNSEALNQFPKSIRAYLLNELGPVSAFLPEH